MKENVALNKLITLSLSLSLESSFESLLRELNFLFFFCRFFGMSDEGIYLFRSTMFLRQEGRHKSRSQVHLLKVGEGFPINSAIEKNDVIF